MPEPLKLVPPSSVPPKKGDSGGSGRNTGGEEPPGGGDMDARVRALEEQMPVINGKLDLILDRLEFLKENSATKADLTILRAEMATKDEVAAVKASVVILASKDDLNAVTRASAKDIQDVATGLHKTLNDQTWKFVTLAAGLAGVAFTAAKLMH